MVALRGTAQIGQQGPGRQIRQGHYLLSSGPLLLAELAGDGLVREWPNLPQTACWTGGRAHRSNAEPVKGGDIVYHRGGEKSVPPAR